MSNKIPFPSNYERFIKLGQKAIKENNLREALNFFEKAYVIVPDFPLNYIIVDLCLELDENERALEIASEMRADYYSHWNCRENDEQLLLKNNKITHSHSIINKQILMKQKSNKNNLAFLKSKLRYVKLRHQSIESKDLQEVKGQLLHLNEYEYYDQLAIIKKAVQLPQEEFIDIGKDVLLNNELHNLVRSWVLEELCYLGYQEKVTFLWRDQQKYSIVPAEAGAPLEGSAYQRIRLFLEKELLNEDFLLLVKIVEELNLHFALLYPMADEVIKDPALWAISYIISSKPVAAYKYQLYNQWREIKEIQKLQHTMHMNLQTLLL
ncbi:hypothetical protein GIX45_27930 [Erwinia sp. CPCC 100877]|nr:hypothetical protein [Erwinia sp. CPCC 100877]